MSKILVTGATGNVGSEVIKALPDKSQVCAADYQPERIKQVFGDSVQGVELDFARPETFAPAFAGVSRVFLMRPPHITQIKQTFAPAIDAMKAAGVQHIVFLSLMGVEKNHFVPHYQIEQLILQSGIPYTFLRPSFFMQNLSTTHRQEIQTYHEIMVPAGSGKTSFIDVRDIAAVAAKTLSEPGHENRAYTLTGKEALSYYEVARIFTEVLGSPFRYTNPSIWRFFRQMRAKGIAASFVLVMIGIYTTARIGWAGGITPDTERLLGRTPITMRQFVQDYRACWG